MRFSNIFIFYHPEANYFYQNFYRLNTDVKQCQALPGIFGKWSCDHAQQKQEVKMVKYQKQCSPPCSMAIAHSYLHIIANNNGVTLYRTWKEQNMIPANKKQLKVFTMSTRNHVCGIFSHLDVTFS